MIIVIPDMLIPDWEKIKVKALEAKKDSDNLTGISDNLSDNLITLAYCIACTLAIIENK